MLACFGFSKCDVGIEHTILMCQHRLREILMEIVFFFLAMDQLITLKIDK